MVPIRSKGTISYGGRKFPNRNNRGETEYIPSSDEINNTAEQSNVDYPSAKGNGYFADRRNWIDYLRGTPNTAQELNDQLTLQQLAGQQNLANNIALAKSQQQNQQQNLVFTQDLANKQGRLNRLQTGLDVMPSSAQSDIQNRALYSGISDQPFIPPSAKFPISTTIDPAVAFQARQQSLAPGFSAERAATTGSNLQTARNQAEILGAGDVISSRDESVRAKNLLDAANSNQGLAILGQNRPLTMQTAGVQAQAGLRGAQGELGVAGDMPKAKLAEENSRTAMNLGAANYYNTFRGPDTAASTNLKETEARLKEEELKNKIDPMRRVNQIIGGLNNPSAGGINAAPNNVVSPGNTSPPSPNQQQPTPITSARPNIDFRTNPDGSLTTILPMLSSDGKTIIPAGTLLQKR